MNKINKNKIVGNIIIGICILILICSSISIYFIKHFNLGTVINGINVSGRTVKSASEKIENEMKNYKLEIRERNGIVEEISAEDINLKYNSKNEIEDIKEKQRVFGWIKGIIKKTYYKEPKIISYDEELLKVKFSNLVCVSSENIVSPKSAKFEYIDDAYMIIDEVYGNKVNKDILYTNIENAISFGDIKLNLEERNIYEKPKYIASSKEVINAKSKLDKYNLAEIIYMFDEEYEVVDGAIINNWINVTGDLEVIIDEEKVKEYLYTLGKKYNTVGKTRKFKTAYGKKIEVEGGYYGWKINVSGEIEALIENIKNGQRLTKEPLYLQTALDRRENDIGDTYVEISINRQYLWFHKDGKIIAGGDIVTGDIDKGFKTNVGTYMLNYKQKGAILEGENYRSEVKYWMPFNGNIGIHDANWRSSFGGNIYKENGSHGCVNAPEYLAKIIFENIEDGTPVICYFEED